MKQIHWDIMIDNKNYRIDFFHSIIFKFRYKIFLNDDRCNDTSVYLDRIGADYHFYVHGYKCTITHRVMKSKSLFDIVIDGISFTSKQRVELLGKTNLWGGRPNGL